MRTCEAIKKSGFRCSHAAQKGLAVCGKHEALKQGRCIGMNANGRRCAQMPSKGNFCGKHHTIFYEKRMRDYAESFWNQQWNHWYHYLSTADEIQTEIDRQHAEGLLDVEWTRELTYRRWGLSIEEHNEPDWLANREPQAFHDDPQNVHRAEVSEQTNKGLAVYLEEYKKLHPHVAGKTLVELMTVWGLKGEDVLFKDLVNWFWKGTCRSEYDWLYHNALAGLWHMIKAHEHKDELQKRLRQECEDAIGMCCEGHLSRLVNVMVGFDPRFDPPVSKNELLQQKMAEIATREISTEEKTLEAKKWMDDNGIVEAERKAWIEAF
jgi:hypothetical protein